MNSLTQLKKIQLL